MKLTTSICSRYANVHAIAPPLAPIHHTLSVPCVVSTHFPFRPAPRSVTHSVFSTAHTHRARFLHFIVRCGNGRWVMRCAPFGRGGWVRFRVVGWVRLYGCAVRTGGGALPSRAVRPEIKYSDLLCDHIPLLISDYHIHKFWKFFLIKLQKFIING